MYRVLTLLSISLANSEKITDVVSCEGSRLSLSCVAGSVINIMRANYGRLSHNICQDNITHDNMSVRCINPTTLGVINNICGGKTSCVVPVISSQLGDPCPHTPKYLQIVYTCQEKHSTHHTQDLPDWIKHINMVTTTTKMTTTTAENLATEKQPTTEEDYSPDVLAFSIVEELIPDSQQLLTQHFYQDYQETKENQIFVNTPVDKVNTIADAMNDKTILAAIVISSVSCFIIFFIGIIIFINRDSSSKSDIYSDSSSSTYLKPQTSEDIRYPPNYIVDQAIYQTIDDYHNRQLNNQMRFLTSNKSNCYQYV